MLAERDLEIAAPVWDCWTTVPYRCRDVGDNMCNARRRMQRALTRKRVARATCIRELEAAESAATRLGDSADTQRIRKYLGDLNQMQESPSRLPRPFLPPSVALANSQFQVSSGKTWHFQEVGVVFTASGGKKVAERQGIVRRDSVRHARDEESLGGCAG